MRKKNGKILCFPSAEKLFLRYFLNLSAFGETTSEERLFVKRRFASCNWRSLVEELKRKRTKSMGRSGKESGRK